MDIDFYIKTFRKTKQLSYYSLDKLDNNFQIPFGIREKLMQVTEELSYLIKYIYNNFFDNLSNYL
jgi:hypothetical protein